MNQSEYIQKILEDKNIYNYKIVFSNKRSFIFKYSFDQLSTEETEINKNFVLFSTDSGTGKIIFSSLDSDEGIKNRIEDALNKTLNDCELEIENASDKPKPRSNVYNNFSRVKYMDWLKREVRAISRITKLSVNLLYKVDLISYELITNDNRLKQYYTNSECTCFEDLTFQKKATLSKIYLSESLHREVIRQFN